MNRLIAGMVFVVLTVLPAIAADTVDAVPEAEVAPVVETSRFGGWYLRGDMGYRWSEFRGARYTNLDFPPTLGTLDGELDGSFVLGGGLGYQANDYLRTDLTADHWFNADLVGTTSDITDVQSAQGSTWLLLANAYADLGTYHGITPYIGAGIGGAHVDWDSLRNTPPGVDHPGARNWRFAFAAMAGASYCVTDNVAIDTGYRYSRIKGGKMFEQVGFEPGPGFDRGFNTHELRAGLRYSFGGGSNCAAAQ